MSYNRNEQQQSQQQHHIPLHQQQHQQQRPINPNTFNTFNPNTNTFYPNNNTAFHNASNAFSSNTSPYMLNTNEPVNNYYQLQQHQQQLYQPQHRSQYTFQTFVPAQPPSLQQFSDPIIPTEPDEFIIDLLRKPQERLFLLKLELDIEAFIKDEKKLRLDLPGMNSYQRLMVHKLAPYYKLNHYHDAMRKGVYVCKTFITELPSVRLQDVRLDDSNNESLENKEASADGADETQITNANPQPTPQFKIMRRSAGSSPSSRNSNNTDDSLKETRKTLEERKTAYEEARARIFQDLEGK